MNAEQLKIDIKRDTANARGKLRSLLDHEASEADEINIDELKGLYGLCDRPLLCMVEDIHARLAIYSNILEEIKKEPAQEALKLESERAKAIKEKYEALKLVEKGTLPNPSLANLAQSVMDKIGKFGRALTEILARHGRAIAGELGQQTGVTYVFQVQLGWPPSLTIGVEHEANVQ